jgi:hypothetical protein
VELNKPKNNSNSADVEYSMEINTGELVLEHLGIKSQSKYDFEITT